MKKEEKKAKRVPLITRTRIVSLTYKFYAMEDGKLNPLAGEEELQLTEKPSTAFLNKKAKEHGVKAVVAELVGEETVLVGMTVDDFYSMAKPVIEGKLVD